MIQTPRVEFELAGREQAIAAGGLGAIMELIRRLDMRREINQGVSLFKLHLPYDEADHVLNIALNLLAGGTCLEHLEDRRCDEAYLNAVGAERIPDPTTAGDFCRRFEEIHVLQLMSAFNRIRERIWKTQPAKFFDCAVIEADGTQVETGAEQKEGIGLNYKGQWGYHPLVVSLANTREPLFIVNRGGNRPSHEQASFYLDLAIDRCRKAGFRKIVLRGDTDFSLTSNFDAWDREGVEFVFGMDARPNLVELAANLPDSAWNRLRREGDEPTPGKQPRAKRPRYRERLVEEYGYQNKVLAREDLAEFPYQPGNCERAYRVVVLRKEVHVKQGQQRLFDLEEPVYFFYVTNVPATEKSAREVVRESNARCNQENNIAQLKQCCLVSPLDNLVSNWAYMVIASLAWNLKAWAALSIEPSGPSSAREAQLSAKSKLLAMDFTTFRDRILMVPAQIVRTARKLVYRLLSYRPSVDLLFLITAGAQRPLRC